MSQKGRLNTRTRLGQAIARSGRPAYVIGAEAGIHPVDLSHMINLRRVIKPDHMRALCRVLECEPEDLVGWVPGMEPEAGDE